MDVLEQAEKEIAEEKFRAEVELKKVHLRMRGYFWIRWFPWRLRRIDRPSKEIIAIRLEYLVGSLGWNFKRLPDSPSGFGGKIEKVELTRWKHD